MKSPILYLLLLMPFLFLDVSQVALCSDTAPTESKKDSLLKPRVSVSCLRDLVVQSNGRQKPLETHARETIIDIFGNEPPSGMTRLEAFVSILFDHDAWLDKKWLHVNNKKLSSQLFDGHDLLSSNELFSKYRELQFLLEQIRTAESQIKDSNPVDQERLDKLNKLNNTIYTLHIHATALYDLPDNFRFLPDPESPELTWLNYTQANKILKKKGNNFLKSGIEAFDGLKKSFLKGNNNAFVKYAATLKHIQHYVSKTALKKKGDSRNLVLSQGMVQIELLYYAVDPRVVGLVIFSLAMLFYIFYGFKKQKRIFLRTGFFFLVCGILWNLWIVGARTAIASRLPLKNLQEVYIVVLFFLPLIGVVLQYLLNTPLYSSMSCFLTIIGLIGSFFLPEEGYRIEPLVAILHSPWKEIHILTIIFSYAVLLVALALHLVFLVIILFKPGSRQKIDGKIVYSPLAIDLDKKAYLLVAWGFLFLTTGIATGAAWGHFAWGRYWGWDPKEVWAAIAWAIYGLFLHLRLFFPVRKEVLAIINIFGYAAILFTYFGVSYLLSGLHSYS